MIATGFTRLVGCAAPVQLAGMGGMTSVALVAAVANAGGLGTFGSAGLPPDVLSATLDAVRKATPEGRIGANFLMPFLDVQAVEQAARACDVVEFFYDTPRADLVRRVHDGGALACWQVGSADEARQALDAGCDLLVAQGVEAGGHVRGTLPLLVLLDRMLGDCPVPVVAAGAPASGRGLAAVLAAGASGLRVGTRFVAALESSAHPDYVEALLRARSDDTVLTTAFGDGWPDAPHRVLRACIEAAERRDEGPVATARMGEQSVPIPRFNVVPPDTTTEGDVAAMCQYAGQSVEGVVRRESAADVVREIVRDAEALRG